MKERVKSVFYKLGMWLAGRSEPPYQCYWRDRALKAERRKLPPIECPPSIPAYLWPPGAPDDWKATFLNGLKASANVSMACKVAGIDRSTAYQARENCKLFAKEWDAAMTEGMIFLSQRFLS